MSGACKAKGLKNRSLLSLYNCACVDRRTGRHTQRRVEG